MNRARHVIRAFSLLSSSFTIITIFLIIFIIITTTVTTAIRYELYSRIFWTLRPCLAGMAMIWPLESLLVCSTVWPWGWKKRDWKKCVLKSASRFCEKYIGRSLGKSVIMYVNSRSRIASTHTHTHTCVQPSRQLASTPSFIRNFKKTRN